MKAFIIILAVFSILSSISLCLTISAGRTQGLINNPWFSVPERYLSDDDHALLETHEENKEFFDIYIKQIFNGNEDDGSYITVLFDIVYPSEEINWIYFIAFKILTYDGEELVAESNVAYDFTAFWDKSQSYGRNTKFKISDGYGDGKSCKEGIANIYLDDFINGDFSFDYEILCSGVKWCEK